MTEVKQINPLENLSVEELESLLEFKKKEALSRKKNIVEQTITVLKAFGKTLNKKHGAFHEYFSEVEGLKLIWDDYGGTIDVYWNDKHVFCSHEVSFRYNPGKWELVLAKLLQEAEKILEEREREEKKQELLKELEKFLELDDLYSHKEG